MAARSCGWSRTAAWTLIVTGALLVPIAGAGQTCTADVQCAGGGRPVASCVGDTLVVRRSICSGMCREVEERRERCSGGGGRCVGGAYERESGRCNASLGVCERRADRELCHAFCSCRDRVLTLSTGQCSEAIGCHRVVRHCPGGCACHPSPQCEGG